METTMHVENGVLIEKTIFTEREKEILHLMKNQGLDFIGLKYGTENPTSLNNEVSFSEINELLVHDFVKEDPEAYHLYVLTKKGLLISEHI